MGLPALRRLRDSRNRRPRPRHPTAALEQRALAVEQPRASENLSIYGGLDLRPFCVVAGHLLPPVSTHGENGLNLSPADALLGRFRAFRAVPRTRVCVVHVRARCLVQQHNTPLCRRFVTGATGLEPATSGVTGRVGHDDARRRTSRNGLICRHLSLSCRLRFAWLSQSSSRRLGHEWATRSCLRGQRHRWPAKGCGDRLRVLRRTDNTPVRACPCPTSIVASPRSTRSDAPLYAS
jgi:hypothetical protein